MEHVDGVEGERRGDETETEAAGALRDGGVGRFVELVAREQVAERGDVDVQRRRAARGDEAIGVERLQLDRLRAGARGFVDERQRAIERAVVIEADLGHHEQRRRRPDLTSRDLEAIHPRIHSNVHLV